jgi:hypothetical protein
MKYASSPFPLALMSTNSLFPLHHICLDLCISGIPHKISKIPPARSKVTYRPWRPGSNGLARSRLTHRSTRKYCWQLNRFNSSKLGALICTNLTKSTLLYKSTQSFHVVLHLFMHINYVFTRKMIIIFTPTTIPNDSKHTSPGHKIANATSSGLPEVT